MYEKMIESLGMSHATFQSGLDRVGLVRKLLEDRESARHEPGALLRSRLSLPMAKEHVRHVSDTFGVIRKSKRGLYAHSGIDIAAEEGTELLVPAKSVVTLVKSFKRSWGNRIDVKILEGPYRHYKLSYSHCAKIYHDLKKGSVVEAGQLVAWVGTTGNSTGPHLHLMIGNNLNFNGYSKTPRETTILGFHDPVSYFDLEGCCWK